MYPKLGLYLVFRFCLLKRRNGMEKVGKLQKEEEEGLEVDDIVGCEEETSLVEEVDKHFLQC